MYFGKFRIEQYLCYVDRLLQFAYRASRSEEDVVNMGLHYILQHLDSSGTYARILFVDFSSPFNTVIPDILCSKLTQLTVPAPTCQWITNFLTDRRQQVRLESITSNTWTISTGAPQGHVLSPLLLSRYMNDCPSGAPEVCRQHKDSDESVYRQQVEQLALWCSQNNLELNMLKTVEMTVDFRRSPPTLRKWAGHNTADPPYSDEQLTPETECQERCLCNNNTNTRPVNHTIYSLFKYILFLSCTYYYSIKIYARSVYCMYCHIHLPHVYKAPVIIMIFI